MALFVIVYRKDEDEKNSLVYCTSEDKMSAKVKELQAQGFIVVDVVDEDDV